MDAHDKERLHRLASAPVENMVELRQCFHELADYVYDYFDDPEIDESVKEELVEWASSRALRFKPHVGKAFNFYTTIMMCYLRQVKQKLRWRKQGRKV